MNLIRIETQRLVIRNFSDRDASAYFQLLSHPEVHCFVSEKIDSIEQAKQQIEHKKTLDDGSELAVALKDTFCVCWNFLAAYGKKGYAYESAKAYLDFLFNRMGARRIYAYVEDDNLSSQHLCQKLGMRLEGIFKEFVSFISQPDSSPLYENTMQFAILKKEWENQNIAGSEISL